MDYRKRPFHNTEKDIDILRTEKLYEKDGMCMSFRATILASFPSEDGYLLLLDRTAFFPEGGGQAADTGWIGDARVKDVQIQKGEILHLTDRLPDGTADLPCRLDEKERLLRMQHHLGEHLLCGAIHRLYGYENVGFHLGADYMTFDVGGILNEEQLFEAERIANEAIRADLPVHCYVPSPDDARPYRAKLERIEENEALRIVEIEGYDRCACCAPHPDRTGRVGSIKLVDAMKYKGGMRVWALAGEDARTNHEQHIRELREASVLLSAKPFEVAKALRARLEELNEARRTASMLRHELYRYRLEAMPHTESSICIFEDVTEAGAVRAFANEGVKKTDRVFAVFFRTEKQTEGYQFVIASRTVPLKTYAAELQKTLGGKCGGSDKMLFGQATVEKETIRRCIDCIV